MDNNISFKKHFSTLGLTQGCSWPEVKRSYRKLIRRWHPDQFHNETEKLRINAEKRMQEINDAYQNIEKYYKKYGALPKKSQNNFQPPQPNNSHDTNIDGHDSSDIHGHVKQKTRHAESYKNKNYHDYGRTSRTRKFFKLIIIISVSYFIYLYWIANDPDTANISSRKPAHNLTSKTDGLQLGKNNRRRLGLQRESYFYPGSSKTEVYDAQGKPDKTYDDAWHYGKSVIYFKNGRVTTWVDDISSPLKIKLARDHVKNTTQPAFRQKYFSKGSTKNMVRKIQGNPIQESTDIWYYGVSKVMFKNGKVTHWYSSPINPLKAK